MPAFKLSLRGSVPMVRWRFNLLVWAIQVNFLGWLFVILGAVFADGAQPARAAWWIGESFHRQLELPVEIHWQDAILHESLQRLAMSQRVAIVLDRRIDPQQRITASFAPTRFIDALKSVSDAHGWGVSVLSPVLYIGPPETTRPLATWHRQQTIAVEQLAPAPRRRWQRVSPSVWPTLTEPRALLAQWLHAARIPVEGLDQIPYDLWPAQNLPALDELQRLIIVLAGFQLAPQVVANGSVKIVPLPVDVTLTRQYAIPPSRLAAVDRLDDELAEAQLTLRQRTLEVMGRAEDHDHVQAWLDDRPRREPTAGSLADKRFTLTVQNQPIAAILQTVAQQLDLELVWHDATKSWRQQRVSLKVENATLGELISTVLQGQSATYRVQQQKLIITPAAAIKDRL
jgi:hypothetical protein